MVNQDIRDRVIEMARQQVGTVEEFDNIVKYNDWYGHGMNGTGANYLKKGQPWCGSCCSYIYNFANAPMPAIDHAEGFVSVPNLVAYAKNHNLITTTPQPGDLVCMDFQGDGKWDHVGIFHEWDDVDHVHNYEGNTSPDDKGSQSNGGGFYYKRRKKSICLFVNLIDNIK